MTHNVYLAADFGGGSGRVMAGWLEADRRLQMEEVYRFPNRPIQHDGHLFWDFPTLFAELKEGLRKAARQYHNIVCLGIDTWGVDFGIIDDKGKLVGLPVCYRDSRTKGVQERFFRHVSRADHYALTGIQQLDINTLFQLLATDSSLLAPHSSLLFMPDLFCYFLTGKACNEYCIASTSELLDARRRTWSEETIAAAGLPRSLFGDIVQPGTVRGQLKKEVADEVGLPEIAVVAVGSHDTASAVCATPLMDGAAFLSSGTWSLLGVETSEPVLTEEARLANFTNEGGVFGTIRFLQNIPGLYPLQRLMAEWNERGEEVSYDELFKEAPHPAPPVLLDVTDERFTNPHSMEKEICAFLTENGATPPTTKCQIAELVLHSLAEKYAEAIESLGKLTGRAVTQINIIGGGSQNDRLNQLTADRTGLSVLAGPVEATAMGNILLQAYTAKQLSGLDDIRATVSRSVAPSRFEPLKP